MTASPGDFIIKGVVGEFYPCKPDIFEQTYEPLSLDFSRERTAAQMEAKRQAYKILTEQDIPIPPDLAAEMEGDA